MIRRAMSRVLTSRMAGVLGGALCVASASASDAAPSVAPSLVEEVSGEAAKPLHAQVFTINPVGPLLGSFATAYGIPTLSVSARYHASHGERIGLTVVPHIGYTDVLGLGNYTAGVKLGPRIALRRTRLAGWYVSPMVLVGLGGARARGRHLSTSLLLGAGAEIGYAWHWSRFVLELGTGLSFAATVGDTAPGPGAPGGWLPVLNVSTGYGW